MTATKTKKKTSRKTKTTASKNGLLSTDFQPPIAVRVAKRLNEGKAINAKEFADECEVSYPAVWQVLRKLYREGLVVRSIVDNREGGKVIMTYSLKK